MGCASYSEEHVLRATHQPLIKLFAMYSLGGRWGLNSNLLEGCFVSSIAYSGALLVSLSGVTVGTIFGSMWIPMEANLLFLFFHVEKYHVWNLAMISFGFGVAVSV